MYLVDRSFCRYLLLLPIYLPTHATNVKDATRTRSDLFGHLNRNE